MKKIVILLILVMMMGVFGACGDKANPEIEIVSHVEWDGYAKLTVKCVSGKVYELDTNSLISARRKKLGTQIMVGDTIIVYPSAVFYKGGGCDTQFYRLIDRKG